MNGEGCARSGSPTEFRRSPSLPSDLPSKSTVRNGTHEKPHNSWDFFAGHNIVEKIPSLMASQDGFHTRPVQVRQRSRKLRVRSGDLQDTDADGCRPCSRDQTSVRASLTVI